MLRAVDSEVLIKEGPLGFHEGVNLRDYAWFWPGLAFTIGLALVMSDRLARTMGGSRLFAFGLIFSLGLIASATLTPSRDALLYGMVGSGTCDFSGFDRPSLRQLLNFSETSLNVILFMPLGITVGFAQRRRLLLALLGASLLLPFAIEATQLIVTPLDRACQAIDVIDNVNGFVLGFVPALVASLAIWAIRAFASGRLRELGERWR
jgi:hypothetical protein